MGHRGTCHCPPPHSTSNNLLFFTSCCNCTKCDSEFVWLSLQIFYIILTCSCCSLMVVPEYIISYHFSVTNYFHLEQVCAPSPPLCHTKSWQCHCIYVPSALTSEWVLPGQCGDWGEGRFVRSHAVLELLLPHYNCFTAPRTVSGIFWGEPVPERQKQEGKTNLHLLKQETVNGSGISCEYANLHLAPDR